MSANIVSMHRYVRLWPIADIGFCVAHVRL